MNLLSSFIKPKNKFSIENLKYLHTTLKKNHLITAQNKNLIVESLRQIAEVMIWGDQHDNLFFDFFLEKNIMGFFITFLAQKTSTEVTIQLLQTLSILVENLRNENSIYFLLSNNYINEIIIHKFDFSSEEVLDYFVSLLKALSLKLDKNTVNFFFNHNEKDFPLYTEAIKFINHKETMIRIAVRTLTLNIFKVENKEMREYIINSTAVPYFSNIVWFIRRHCMSLSKILEKSSHDSGTYQLKDYVDELTDQFYYLHDIFNLGFESMNIVLAEQFIQYLIYPVFIGSLIDPVKNPDLEDRLTPTLALYLLAQVFNIFSFKPLLDTISSALLTATPSQAQLFTSATCAPPPLSTIATSRKHYNSFRRFSSFPNLESLEAMKNEGITSISDGQRSHHSVGHSSSHHRSMSHQHHNISSTDEEESPPNSGFKPSGLSSSTSSSPLTTPKKYNISRLFSSSNRKSVTANNTPLTSSPGKSTINPSPTNNNNSKSLSSSIESTNSLESDSNLNINNTTTTTTTATTSSPPPSITITNGQQQQTNSPPIGSPPQLSTSQQSIPVRKRFKFNRNEFKESLLNLIHNDRETFGVVIMLYSFLKNTHIDHRILEKGGILPYRLAKAKKLLQGLLSPESTPSNNTNNTTTLLNGGTTSEVNSTTTTTNTSTSKSTVTSPNNYQQSSSPLANRKNNKMSASLPINIGHNRSRSESHAKSILFNPNIYDNAIKGEKKSIFNESSPVSLSLFGELEIETTKTDDGGDEKEDEDDDEDDKDSIINVKTSTGDNSANSSLNNVYTHEQPINANASTTTILEDDEEAAFIPVPESSQKDFTRKLINTLFMVLVKSNQFRLVTLQMTLLLLKELVYSSDSSSKLTEIQALLLEQAYNTVTDNLKECLSGPLSEVFLEIFEEELRSYKQIFFETLLDDVALILPIPEKPVRSLSLSHRLPSGELERTQKAIQQFLVLRELKFTLLRKKDTLLPLKQPPTPNVREKYLFNLDSTRVSGVESNYDIIEYYHFEKMSSANSGSGSGSSSSGSGSGGSGSNIGLPSLQNASGGGGSGNSGSAGGTPRKKVKQYGVLFHNLLLAVDPMIVSGNTGSGTGGGTSGGSTNSTGNNSPSPSTSSNIIGGVSKDGIYGIIVHIAPLQRLEIEISHRDASILRVTSHPTTWNVEMVFDEPLQCLKAKQLLERVRDDVRATKMRQIYALLGEKDPDDDSVQPQYSMPSTNSNNNGGTGENSNNNNNNNSDQDHLEHNLLSSNNNGEFSTSMSNTPPSRVITPIDTSNSHPLAMMLGDDSNNNFVNNNSNSNINHHTPQKSKNRNSLKSTTSPKVDMFSSFFDDTLDLKSLITSTDSNAIADEDIDENPFSNIKKQQPIITPPKKEEEEIKKEE